MNSHFTKSEMTAMFKDFLFIIGADVPEGSIKQAWTRFMEIKYQEKWQRDLEALIEEGLIEAVYDERDQEWHYEPTELGMASARARELERIG